MEEKNQNLKKNEEKSKIKISNKSKANRNAKNWNIIAKQILKEANDKPFGRKITKPELLISALFLVKSDHIKILQSNSMKNEDRQEILRQKYIELNGHISKDEFIGFMMTPDFQVFLKEQSCNLNF